MKTMFGRGAWSILTCAAVTAACGTGEHDEALAPAAAEVGVVTRNTIASDGWTASARARYLTPFDPTAPHEVTATITFARTSGASTRGGGVCLATQPNGSVTCNQDSDCPGYPSGGYVNGWTYCVQADGDAQKQCWTKPGGDEWCFKNPFNSPGTYSTQVRNPNINGQNLRWIGVSCLADTATPTGCGSTTSTPFVRGGTQPRVATSTEPAGPVQSTECPPDPTTVCPYSP